MTNFTFKDASGTTQTAGAASVASALYTQVHIVDSTSANTAFITTAGEILVKGSVVTAISPGSVSGVGVFNVNPIGSGSIITAANPSSVSGVGLFNVNHTGNGSILVVIPGSVATAPSPASISGVGIFNTIIQAGSIAGTYTEDGAHVTNDRGIFTLAVRNDTMSSVTSADGDYSAQTVGPIGEVVTANAPITKWWQAQASVMYGVSVLAFAAQGASVFTYITGIQVANDSGTFSRVKITGGLGSVLAWTVAPANGGSNIQFINALKTGENSGVSASINGVSSVYLTMEGFISKI